MKQTLPSDAQVHVAWSYLTCSSSTLLQCSLMDSIACDTEREWNSDLLQAFRAEVTHGHEAIGVPWHGVVVRSVNEIVGTRGKHHIIRCVRQPEKGNYV